ncbi:hypothetical protein IID62_09735, partial [candidate division KSB1 bacterium]|nr:hypothetical protein [candidate division KSB1 bacterium]
KINPKAVVFDEIQALRNTETKKYEACKALSLCPSIESRLGLSGTPIYNHGLEMFNICELIKPGVLGERSEFIRRYCMHHDSSKSSEDGKIGLAKLLRKTIMIRRKKIDVLKDFVLDSFEYSDLEYLNFIMYNIEKNFQNAKSEFLVPTLALDYLKSDRDPMIMERQQPEMREAIQLLVDAFDKGPERKEIELKNE